MSPTGAPATGGGGEISPVSASATAARRPEIGSQRVGELNGAEPTLAHCGITGSWPFSL